MACGIEEDEALGHYLDPREQDSSTAPQGVSVTDALG